MSTLFDLTTEYQALLDLGDSADPEDQQAFLDTLDGLNYEVGMKADDYASVMTLLTGRADTVHEEIQRLQKIEKTLSANIERMKASLQNAMESMGKTEIKTALHTFKVVKNGGKLPLKITGDVPQEYCRITYEKDTERIRKALDDGKELDFAEYGERGKHLVIK